MFKITTDFKEKMGKNKNDHRSGGAVKEGCPYICIKHTIKLIKKKNVFLSISVLTAK